MLIKTLTMSNWRPFYGDQTLDLTTESGRPMIWVHANNMRGKTSILNAVRWCLYGTTLDSGRERPSHRNVNKQAVQEGDFHSSVRLTFTHDEDEYSLERHIQWDREPTSAASMEERVDLRVNHQIQSPGEVDRQIRNILHPNISQFYLFDGELIREFEDRLGADRASGFVRQAVEQILGLPALSLAAEDLEFLADKAGRELRKQLKQEKAYQKISEELDGIAAALESASTDLQGLLEEESKLEDEREEMEEAQRQFEEVRQLLRERDLIVDEVRRLEDDRERLSDRIKTALVDSWWIPVETRIGKDLAEAEAALDEQKERQLSIRHLESRIKDLTSSLEEKVCKTCGQTIPGEHFGAVEHELSELKTQLHPLLQGRLDLEDSLESVTALRTFMAGSTGELLRQASEDVAKLDLDIYTLNQKIKGIDRGLKESDAKDVADIQRRLERVNTKLGETRGRRERAQMLKAGLENQQKEKRAHITKLPGKADRARQRSAILDGLERIYRASIDQFRDTIRSDVEATASDLFLAFTTEKEFQGVEIDSGYRLTIIDSAGRPVVPSAGAQQALALALIGGLNAAAVREGPLVIDTPLARFDLGYRHNIIESLPRLGDQVVLLVQPGEFDRVTYIEDFSHLVTREFTVKRISDQRSDVAAGYAEDALVF